MPHISTIRWRRRCRSSRQHMLRTAFGMACLMLCFILSTAHTDEQFPDRRRGRERRNRSADETMCSEDGDTCSSSDQPEIKIRTNTEGGVTLHAQTYGSTEYGHKIMREVKKIQNSAPLLEKLERQRLRSQSGVDEVDEIRITVFDITTTLVGDLMSLASVHKEEWMQIMLDPPLGSESEEDIQEDRVYSEDHFDKAVNAYEAVLIVYERLWHVVQPGAPHDNMGQVLFSPYDAEAISSGQTSVYVTLSDMFHQRFNTRLDYATSGDCTEAYRYLIQAQSWCEQSMSILGVTLEGDTIGQDIPLEKDADHDAAVIDVTQNVAFIQVRFGAILIEMFALGYVLDSGSSAFTKTVLIEESGEGERYQLGDGQKQLLDLTLKKLVKGLSIYTSLAEEEATHKPIYAQYRLNIADSRNYMGVVHGYLFEWAAAVDDLETSISIYEEIFTAYYKSGMGPESLDIASSMIQTSQSLWEAYLNLSGRIDDAKKIFRRHLILRRYFESQVSLDQPLADEEEVEDLYYDDLINNSYQSNDANYEETLKTYQKMLNEYLQLQSEYPPDGSYYEMGFDYIDSEPTYVQHDNVYEGSLRSAIGSLKLSVNKLWEAKDELESAVRLLSDSVDEDADSFEAYDENGEIIEYPVRLELANALLNLSYALLGLKQWRSSFESFEEAMDLYQSELAEGETPMNHSDPPMMEATKGSQSGWGDMLTHFTKGSTDMEEETLDGDDSNEKGSIKEEARYMNITIDDYHIVQNITEL